MKILVINVNTTESMTQEIAKSAQGAARTGTEIIALTPTIGAESVEGNVESHLAAVAVMDRILAYEGDYDAIIQAGFGEHGREALQELFDVPVVDITEAAAHVATLIGRTFSIVTTLDRTVPLIEDRLLLSGLASRCASVRASGLGVLELNDPHTAIAAIADEARKAVEQDRAEVIVLGCGGMAGLEEAVRDATNTPVVDGVAAAVALAEGLVQLGLSTSKIRTYAPPLAKEIRHWPLHTALKQQ